MKKIEIKGHIVSDDHLEVYQWFGINATSPSLVKAAIAEAEAEGEKELLVEINSGGGSVFAGTEIYYTLKKFNGTVNGEIPSIAASAATFPAMACDKLSMSLMGQFMIHGASTYGQGNHQDMADTSEFLRNIDDSIINAYMNKTSKTRDELRTMMDKDSWMTAQQALEAGFIDEILFENKQDAVASANQLDNSTLLPQDVIDKVKAEILSGKLNNQPVPVNVAEPIQPQQTQTKEENKMDLTQLQNEHPELFNEVKNLGFAEGQSTENARIKEIEDLAMPGNEELVNAAKFENKSTAAELAVAIVKAEKQKGANYLNNRTSDAEPLNAVPGTQENPVNSNTKEEAIVDELTNIWGGKK